MDIGALGVLRVRLDLRDTVYSGNQMEPAYSFLWVAGKIDCEGCIGSAGTSGKESGCY